MKQYRLQDRYPLYTLEPGKSETRMGGVEDVAAYLKDSIAARPVARFIADFDRHVHAHPGRWPTTRSPRASTPPWRPGLGAWPVMAFNIRR